MIIDISEWQNGIKYDQLKSSGVDGVIVRVGKGPFKGDGVFSIDDRFYQHMDALSKTGLPLGAYWFSYAINEQEALKEADSCCDFLDRYQISMPVFFDFEDDSEVKAKKRGVTVTKDLVTKLTVAFCERVRQRGYIPGTYFNMNWYRYRQLIDLNLFRKKNYAIWYAQYSDDPWLKEGVNLWQYTDKNRIAAYNGLLDSSNVIKDCWTKNKFKPNNTMTRAEAVQVIWARCGRTIVTEKHQFVDVPSGVWYETALNWAVNKGIVEGKPEDKRFNPNKPVTRAQLLVMLWRVSGSPVVRKETPFVDVEKGIWYETAVKWAWKNNLVAGVTATKFAPNNAITRAQMITILWACAGRPDTDLTVDFDDVDNTTYYAVPISWAVKNRYVAGYKG